MQEIMQKKSLCKSVALVLAIAAVHCAVDKTTAGEADAVFPITVYPDAVFVPLTIDGTDHIFVVDRATPI